VVKNDIKELLDKKAVAEVCGAAMKRHNIDKSQLLAGVEIVPDGIYEITTKQREGWGSFKFPLILKEHKRRVVFFIALSALFLI
jgi:intracellular sulfur oxidation DsrE/DsrF family protein